MGQRYGVNVKKNSMSLMLQRWKSSQDWESPEEGWSVRDACFLQESINMQALLLSGQNVVIKVLLLCDLGPLALSVP